MRRRSGFVSVVVFVLMGVLGILLWAHYTQFRHSIAAARALDQTLARRIAVEDLLEIALARCDEWMNEEGHALRSLALTGGRASIDAAAELPGYQVPGELDARESRVEFETLDRRALPPPASPTEGARTLKVTATLTFPGKLSVAVTRVVAARVANLKASPAVAHALAITRAQDQYWQSRGEPLDYVNGPKREPKDSSHHAWHRYNSAKNRLRVLKAPDGQREGPVFFGPRPTYDPDQPILLNASMNETALGFLAASPEANRRPTQDPRSANPAADQKVWRALALHLYEQKAGFFGVRVAGPFSIDIFLVLHPSYTGGSEPWNPPNDVRMLEPDTIVLGWGNLAAEPDFSRLLLDPRSALCSTAGGTRVIEAYLAALEKRGRAPLVTFSDEAALDPREPTTLNLAGARSISGPVATRGVRLLTLGVNWQIYRSYFLPLPVLPAGPEDGGLRDTDVIDQVQQMAGAPKWPKGKPGPRLGRLVAALKAAGGLSSYAAIRRGAPGGPTYQETLDLPPEAAARGDWLTVPEQSLNALGGDIERVAYQFPDYARARPYLEVEPGLLRVNGIVRVDGPVAEAGALRYTGRGVLAGAGPVTLADEVRRKDPEDALVVVARDGPVKLGPDAPASGPKTYQAGLVALSSRAAGATYLGASVGSTFAQVNVEGFVAASSLGVAPDLSITRDSARFDVQREDDGCVVSVCRMPVLSSRKSTEAQP